MFLLHVRLHLQIFFILLTCIYIRCFNFTFHLIMIDVRSKRRFLPLIFIVKSFKKPLIIRFSIAKISVTSSIVVNMPTRMLLGSETKDSVV